MWFSFSSSFTRDSSQYPLQGLGLFKCWDPPGSTRGLQAGANLQLYRGAASSEQMEGPAGNKVSVFEAHFGFVSFPTAVPQS